MRLRFRFRVRTMMALVAVLAIGISAGFEWKNRAERDRLARGRANCYREAAIHYKRAMECQLAIAAKTPYQPATRAKLLAGDRVRGFSFPGGFLDWQGELANHLYWGQRIFDESDVWDLRVRAIEARLVLPVPSALRFL